VSVTAEYHGANGFLPVGGLTEIDTYVILEMVEDKRAGQLRVRGSLVGDNFPATEALIRDASGQTVFLGIGFYESQGGDQNTGPMLALPGDNRRPIAQFDLTLTLDNKGNFTGVVTGGKKYSVADWNRKFSKCNPHRRSSC
jgi:hypothetical protein